MKIMRRNLLNSCATYQHNILTNHIQLNRCDTFLIPYHTYKLLPHHTTIYQHFVIQLEKCSPLLASVVSKLPFDRTFQDLVSQLQSPFSSTKTFFRLFHAKTAETVFLFYYSTHKFTPIKRQSSISSMP